MRSPGRGTLWRTLETGKWRQARGRNGGRFGERELYNVYLLRSCQRPDLAQLVAAAASISRGYAEAHFGSLAMWVAGNGPASSVRTRAALGWESREIGIVADIERPNYPADRAIW